MSDTIEIANFSFTGTLYLKTIFQMLFRKMKYSIQLEMSDASETANFSFTGTTYISETIFINML